jgi:phosphotransferase system HPr (HPr) family protein
MIIAKNAPTVKDGNFVGEVQRTIVVPRPFHRRLAENVVRIAQRFESDIFFSVGSLKVDAKSSIMALMFLQALNNQPLVVTARGVDSDRALRAFSEVVQPKAIESPASSLGGSRVPVSV